MRAASPAAASTATWTTLRTSTSCGWSMSPPAAMRDAWSRSSMMRSRERALRSMISSARSLSAASNPPCRSRPSHTRIAPRGVRSSWESSARNSSLRWLVASARCRAACSRSMRLVMSRVTRRLWTNRPSRKSPLPSIRTCLMEPSLGSKAGLVGFDALLAGEPTEDVGGGLRLDEELGDVLADVLGLGVPDEVQLGPVRPEDAPVGAHPAQADRGADRGTLAAPGRSRAVAPRARLSSVAACRKAADDGDQLGRLHGLGQV